MLQVLLLPLLSCSADDPPSITTYADLISFIHKTLIQLTRSASETKRVDAILNAHPRLGVSDGSERSRAEQAGLGGEELRLRELNEEYERKFGGLRYM